MKNNRGNMLLLELVIVLLFFALAQVVVVRLFVQAQQINENARVMNLALTRAQDAAETLATAPTADAALLELGFTGAQGQYQLISADGYRLTATVHRLHQPAGTLASTEIAGFQGDTELFSLPAAHYEGVSP